MKGFRLFFMLALLTAFTVGTAYAADYYVFANQHGQRTVLDHVPSAGWTLIDGPYATLDMAKRGGGIGTFVTPGGGRFSTPAKAAF